MIAEESFGIIPLKLEKGSWKVFIILHKKGDHWSFPKGHPHPGENPQESAIRELKEETGLQVERFLQENSLTEVYSFYHQGKKVHKTVHYFPALVTGQLALQPEEIQAGKWVSFEEADSLLTFEEAKKICKQVQALIHN